MNSRFPISRQAQILFFVLSLPAAERSIAAEAPSPTPAPKPTATPTASATVAQANPIKTLILPGEAFLVDARPAFVFLPPKEKRRTPQPWVIYAPTLPGLPDNAERWMHEQLLAAGVAVAGIDCGESYGSPKGRRWMSKLYEELTTERGFAKKVCLLGRSRGGLQVMSWAVANPDRVAGIAGIYPVLDLRSYPGLKRAAGAYETTPEELESKLAEHNPIAKGAVLAESAIPLFLIHGDVDKVVPLEPNSGALAKIYHDAGAADLLQLEVPKGQGHNMWIGFFQSRELVDFVVRSAKDAPSTTATPVPRK